MARPLIARLQPPLARLTRCWPLVSWHRWCERARHHDEDLLRPPALAGGSRLEAGKLWREPSQASWRAPEWACDNEDPGVWRLGRAGGWAAAAAAVIDFGR